MVRGGCGKQRWGVDEDGDGGISCRLMCEGGGGGVELVTRMAAGVWGSDDGDGHEGGVMVAAVGRQPEVGGKGVAEKWIWGSDPSEVLSIRGSHNSRDSISLK
ncbi:hypothetical protein Tco_0706244, partial [Tanacetum coccineum]